MIDSDKPIINKGTYSGYIEFAIWIVGEAIWNATKRQDKECNESKDD